MSEAMAQLDPISDQTFSELAPAPVPDRRQAGELYGFDYFERGAALGISGYTNYSWMPELTLRMAHHMIAKLPVHAGQRVLDYGCAKGFVVRALRILGVEAYGVDISPYAIAQVPSDTAPHCRLIEKPGEIEQFGLQFDWMISKDVFEHIPETALPALLEAVRGSVRRMFVAVPLGHEDGREGFIIPSYDQDVTHVTVKPMTWWRDLFCNHGWRITAMGHSFVGVKENWLAVDPLGNGFFLLERSGTAL